MVVAFPGNDLQPDLQRVTTVVGKDQGQVEMQVLQEERLVSKLFAGHGPGQFQMPGPREDDLAIDLMIAEVRELLHVQCGLPDRETGFRDQLSLTLQEGVFEATPAQLCGGGILEPMPTVLPRIVGQSDIATIGAEHHRGVRLQPARRQSCQALEEHDHFGFLASHRRRHHRLGVALLEQSLGTADQHGMRTDFHKRVEAVIEHRAERVREQDRLTRVLEPVIRVQMQTVFAVAGDGRVQRRRGLDALHLNQCRQHDALDRLHVMAVIRHLDPNRSIEDSASFQRLRNDLKRSRVA